MVYKLWKQKGGNCAILQFLCLGNQFDRLVSGLCDFCIQLIDLCDAIEQHLINGRCDAIAMGKQEHPFVCSVKPFNIQCRICFCKAELLGQQQGFLEIQFFLKHFGEDEIRGSIDDGLDGMQEVVVIILLQVPDDGDGCTCRGLVQQRPAGGILKFDEFWKVL